ncbi:hypothetical protein TKK_0016030 [Trichogramma kaykai]
MALLAASVAELRAVGTLAASSHVTRTPAAVAARSLLATTDATAHPADPYVAELHRFGRQVIRECDYSHLCSRVCLPQRFHGVQCRGDLLLGDTLVQVLNLDHGRVLQGTGCSRSAKHLTKLLTEGGGVVHAFLQLQH